MQNKEIEAFLELRDYQRDTVEKLNILDKESQFSTIISLPAGAGKTRLAKAFCIEKLLEGYKILWLSDRVNLLTQSRDEFLKGDFLNDIKTQVICSVNGDAVTGIREDTNMLFASVSSITSVAKYESKEFKTWINSSQDNNKKLYVIYDEAHHIGAYDIRRLFESLFTNSDTLSFHYHLKRFGLIGLTATVFRNDRVNNAFYDWFKDGFKEDKKVHLLTEYGSSKIPRDNELKNNMIEPVKLVDLLGKVLVNPLLYKVDDFANGVPKTDEEQMEYLSLRIKKYHKRWGKTIVFVKDRTQAMLLAMKLQDAGVKCFAYISSQGIENIDKVIAERYSSPTYVDVRDDKDKKGKEFQNKDSNYQLMIAVNKVSEGYDVPDLNTVYLYAPIQSHILLRQRIGRVLRNTDECRNKKNFKTANVYWQSYPQKNDNGELPVIQLNDIPDTIEKIMPQTDAEQLEDVKKYDEALKTNNIMQIPAAMFKEELPDSYYRIDNYESGFEFLEILKMFDLSELDEESIGFFYNSEDLPIDECIFVGKKERQGYVQLYNTIRVDYIRNMHWFGNDISDFTEYAKMLKIDEATLLADIKKTCFYLSNTNKYDTKLKIHSRKIKVNDDDIKKFCQWVFENDVSMPLYYAGSIESNENTDSFDENVLLTTNIEEYYKQNSDESRPETIEQVIEKIADIKKWREKKKVETHTFNKAKEYTDSLTYGKEGEFIYQEMLSARSLIRMGAIKYPRFTGVLDGENVELAFIGCQDNKLNLVTSINRVCENRIADNDMLVIANAIIHTVNHIYVTDNEIKEYQKRLLDIIPKAFDITIEDLKNQMDGDLCDGLSVEDKLTLEFLMALGYSYSHNPAQDIAEDTDNDKILRMQCKVFGDSLPDIIRYVIYDRVYVNLYPYVNYHDSEGKLHPKCRNVDELNERYKEILAKYGVKQAVLEGDDLTPLEDVIYDYRPYIKAVQNYQGIKPEFLCRLVNDVFQLDMNTNFDTFVDGFGGSGACSMNSFYKDRSVKPERTYNDFGDINVAFYRCLDNESDKHLIEQKIDDLFKRAISYARGREEDEGDKLYLDGMFGKYCSKVLASIPELQEIEQIVNENDRNTLAQKRHRVENAVKFLKDDIDKIETEYLRSNPEYADIDVKKPDEDDTIAKKITRANYNYEKVFISLGYSPERDKIDVRQFEKYIHVMMLRIKWIYLLLEADDGIGKALEDWQKAFIFFMNNSLSSRHRYNDCLIGLLIDFCGGYREYLDRGTECMHGVKRSSGDALELLRSDILNGADTKFYLDIPYSETDASTYVVDGFDEIGFIDCLANLKGTYLVSSRFNICVGKNPNEDGYSDKLKNKMKNVIVFYNSFNRDDTYEKILKEKDFSKNKYRVGNIGNNEAKYVLFPFTKKILGEDFVVKKDDKKKAVVVKELMLTELRLYSKLTSTDVGRMLAGTQLSNIPVEVMVTNAELDISRKPIQKLDDDIWVMPTFKTGVDSGQYKTEPVIVIMRYEAYLHTLYKTLFPEAWDIYSNKEEAKLVAKKAGTIWGFNFK